MIIQSLHIEKFGKWNGLRLQNLEAGINLFYGPNETGKTTLMQFIRAIFYGFSAERLAYAYQPEPERTGGELQILTAYGTWNVNRRLVPLTLPLDSEENLAYASAKQNSRGKSASNALPSSELPFFAQKSFQNRYQTRSMEDGLKIENSAGVRQDTFQWRNLLELAGSSALGKENVSSLEMDETLFNSIFALGLQELQKLSVLDSTEAAKRLYDLSTGIERYSLRNLISNLHERQEDILPFGSLPEALKTEDLQWCGEFFAPTLFSDQTFLKSRQSADLLSLLNYRKILQKQGENIQTQNKQYGKIHSELTDLEIKIKHQQELIQQTKHKIRILEIAQEVQDVWDQRARIDTEIVDFGTKNSDLIEISDRTIEIWTENLNRLSHVRKELGELQERAEELRTEKQNLIQKRKELQLDANLLQKIPTIEIFLQQQEWIETLNARLDNLYRQQMDSEAQLSIDYRRLGLAMPDWDQCETVEEAFPYDVRALRPLRTPIREMKRIQKQIQNVKKRRAELFQQAGEKTGKIGEYLLACRERMKRNPAMASLPGMAAFPDMFLIQETESAQKSMKDSAEAQRNALNSLNSQIVSEIPDEILTQGAAKNSRLEPKTTLPSMRSQTSKESGKNAHVSQTSNSANSSIAGKSGKDSTLKEETPSPAPALLDVTAASRFLGEVLGTLRRSEIHLQQLIQAIQNEEKQEQKLRILVQKQVLSAKETIFYGAIFSFGMALSIFEMLQLAGILAGEYGLTDLFCFLIGTAAWLGLIFWRITFSQKLDQKLLQTQADLENLAQQKMRLIRLFFAERESEVLSLSRPQLLELCRQEEAALQKKCEFIEKELAEAESIETEAAKHTAFLTEAQHLNVRLQKLTQALRQAKTKRKELLRSLALPEDWKQANIRQLMDASDRIREIWRRRNRDIEDFQLYSKELQLLVERLETTILPILGEEFSQNLRGGNERFPFAPNLFAEIQAKIQKEKNRHSNAEQLEKKIREIHRQLKKLHASYTKKKQGREQILELSNAPTEKHLREKVQKLELLKELRGKRRTFQKEIDQVLDFSCTESMLWEVYEGNSAEQIAERRKILCNALAENEFQLEAAQKREMECKTILEKIVSDPLPSKIQYELHKTNAKIAHAANAWQIFSMTQRLIQTIQKTYQQKRQPKTLEAASKYLRDMTEGKYERVWTPVDEDLLFVQRADGSVFSTEQLSMGTRELLYLAIRLAFIEEYRTKNISLPVILDDVLVNFDRQRATAAARVLTRFAGDETQIFFFTSHEHIREIFVKENALICDMVKR